MRLNQIALKALPNTKRDSYRAAVVVSRKVHKSAVARNRIRRRVYEALRTLESGISKPYDLIFIVYSDEFAVMDYPQLEQTVQLLLKRAGIIPG